MMKKFSGIGRKHLHSLGITLTSVGLVLAHSNAWLFARPGRAQTGLGLNSRQKGFLFLFGKRVFLPTFVFVWFAIVTLMTSVFYFRVRFEPVIAAFHGLFIWQFLVWLPWLFFPSAIIKWSDYVRRKTKQRGFFFLAHLLGSLVLAFGHLVWNVPISMEFSPYSAPAFESASYGVFRFVFVFWFIIDILLYWVLLFFHLLTFNPEVLWRGQSFGGQSINFPRSYFFGRQNLKKIEIKQGRKKIEIMAKEIILISAKNYYANIMTNARKFQTRVPLKRFEFLLGPEKFLRIHRGTLINLDHLLSLKKTATGGSIVEMSNGVKKEVSRKGLKKLKEKMPHLF